MTLLSFALACGGVKAMKLKIADQFVTTVIISGEQIPERVAILPYTSTGTKASVKLAVEEAPGVTLNGLLNYARQVRVEQKGLEIKLLKPVLINVTTRHPELFVGLFDDEGKMLKSRVFDEDDISDFGNKNRLEIVHLGNENYSIDVKPVE